MDSNSGSGGSTRSCPRSAPAFGLPYLPSSLPPSEHASNLTPVRHAFSMNRSWHWQMQVHRNYLRLSDTVYSADRSFQHPCSNTTTMDPTTLVTFLFKAPPEARTVELLGSWDNFTHPYLMEHDRRRGTGFWSGCFKFEDIIFDGDSSSWNKPRTGGLKQGGTYWYFYRLNDDAEAYDDSKPFTTTCPLLPGQPVNMIEVPVEMQEAPPRAARSASMDVAVTIGHLPSTQTLNPQDKFNPLNPPPISKVHGRCLSDYALNGRLETKPQEFRNMESNPSPPQSSAHETSWYEDDEPVSPNNQPSQRYYADDNFGHDDYAVGRTSFNSQRSWLSSSSSFARSSSYGEYTSRANPFDLTPVAEVPSSPHGHVTGVSYVEDTLFDFGFNESSSSSWIEDVEPWLLESERYPPLNPPLSATGEQAPAPRPTTSPARMQRPPLHRWSTQDLHNAGHFSDDWKLPDDITAEEAEEDIPIGERYTFDVLSPSFSAATISTVGANTPFRLSVGASGTMSAYDPTHNNDSSMQQVADRLRSLSAVDLHERTTFYGAEDAALSTYTLPNPETAPFESVLGADKLSSHESSFAFDVSLPSIMQQTTSGSLEDDIFSALSF